MTWFAQSGLFLNEWYWDPIFGAFKALPVLALVGLVTGLVLRRWLTLPVCAGVASSIVVGGAAVVLAVGLYIASGEHARDSRGIARTIGFTTYQPRSLPPRFALDRSAAAAGRDAPSIHTFYSLTGNGWASVIQEQPPGERHSRYTQDCLLKGRSGPCRAVRSANGIRVMVAPTGSVSVEASALVGGTLVNLMGDRITEPEILAYFESLEPVAPVELEFKRG
jgi:hypothetical protein